MIEQQETLVISTDQLIAKAQDMFKEHYRLVQIGCTKVAENNFEINYSFDKDFKFINYRIVLTSTDQEIPSISAVYPNSFLYENEIHDLFGVKIKGISIDYKGTFYRTSVKTPFNVPEQKVGEQK